MHSCSAFSGTEEFPPGTRLPALGGDLDHVFAQLVAPAVRRDVDLGSSTRWWGYRDLHPLERLLIVEHEWLRVSNVYRDRFARYLKRRREPQSILAVPGNDDAFRAVSGWSPSPREKARATCFVKISVMADVASIPYPVWVSGCFEGAMARHHKGLEPNQAYSETSERDAVKRWKACKKEGLLYTTHPHFQADAFTGDEVQKRYCRFLLDQTPRTASPIHVATWLPLLSRDLLVAHMGEEQVAAAERLREQHPNLF